MDKSIKGSCRREFSTDVKNILVLYTGGTIGMVQDATQGLVPKANSFIQVLRQCYQLHNHADENHNITKLSDSWLVLPPSYDGAQILYHVVEYEELIDSSNMGVKRWKKIASDIKDSYEEYDGFVVLHGTDTLAYTASALSFMFSNLSKTVVITGAQVPIFKPHTDAVSNLVSSLVVAATSNIPHVVVVFGNTLHLGNRCTKVDSWGYSAFDSPNSLPLARMAVNFSLVSPAPVVASICNNSEFNCNLNLNSNVVILHMFPDIPIKMVHGCVEWPTEGVVLLTYGAGNIASDRADVLAALTAACALGVIIVNVTQCLRGGVNLVYGTGTALSKAGVIPGYEMTAEATFTKLQHVLALEDLSVEEKKQMMMKNLRCERNSVVI